MNYPNPYRNASGGRYKQGLNNAETGFFAKLRMIDESELIPSCAGKTGCELVIIHTLL
jgi:hypothetical protein